jgi:hypothetical protein
MKTKKHRRLPMRRKNLQTAFAEWYNNRIPGSLSALGKSLFFSFMAYLFVLFVIIALDTFSNRDFSLSRSVAISAVYISALVVLFAIMMRVFRIKLK